MRYPLPPLPALLLSFSLILALCGICGAEAGVIGYILPLTGDAAPFGMEAQRGVRLAQEDLERKGHRLRTLFEDERCLPKDAVSAWQKLSTVEKATVIVGPGCTGSIIATAGAAAKSNRPLLALWDAGREVEASGPHVYSIGYNSEEEGALIAAYLKDKNLSRVGVFWEEDKFAVIVKEAFEAALKAGGAIVSASASVAPGEQDLRAPLSRIISSDPHAIFVSPAYSAVAAVQTLRRLGWRKPILGQDTFGFPGVIEAAGPAIEGVIFSDFALMEKNQKAKDLERRYIERYGREPSSLLFVSFGHDSLLVASALPRDTSMQKGVLGTLNWEGALPFTSFEGSRMLRLRPSLFIAAEGRRRAYK